MTRRIATQVREHRKARKWSAQRLSDACAELGMEFPRSTLADLETGRRSHISVAEFLVLARALDVGPIDLLMRPERDEAVELLPGTSLSAADAADWFCSGMEAPTLAAIRHKAAELSRLLGCEA